MNPNKVKKVFVYVKSSLVSNALSFMLQDNYFAVSTFNDQKDFLKQVIESKPDIVLFDYVIEKDDDTDIYNLYIKFRLSFKNTPVILLFSSSATKSIKKLLSQNRPDSMIKKPFKLMELLDKLNKILYSGDLTRYSFPYLLQTFSDERRTGVLHITIEDTKHFIYFIDGQIVFIEYGFRKDTLGLLLLKSGKITEEQYNNAISDAAKNRTRLGASLIKLKYLSPAGLNEALENQIYEKILNCFSGTSGSYSFKFQDRFVEDIIIYRYATEKVILEGVKRHYDTQKLKSFIDTMKAKKFKISSGMQESLDLFGFGTEEMKIVSKLKSICTYDELVLMPEVDKSLLKKLLFILSATGYLIAAEKGDEVMDEQKKAIVKRVEKKIDELLYLKEEAKLKDMVYEAYLKIKSLNYYDMLDVPRDAGLDVIKAAYTRLAKKYHPDKYTGKHNPDLVNKVTEIFAKLKNAYDTLKDPTLKKEYDYTIDHPDEAKLLSNANEILSAEMEFLRGEKLIEQREFEKAEKVLETAVKLNAEEPEYKCFYGWAHFLNPKNNKIEKIIYAKELINEALGINPNIEMAYYFLGSIERFSGNLNLALKNFKKALDINPDNREARMIMNMIMSKGKK